MTPSELEAFAEKVAERVADKLSSRPELVDRGELARLLGLSVPTIERLTAKGAIPCVRFGRRVLYDVVSVIEARSKDAKGGEA